MNEKNKYSLESYMCAGICVCVCVSLCLLFACMHVCVCVCAEALTNKKNMYSL